MRSWLQSIGKNWRGTRSGLGKGQKKNTNRFRPAIEALEDRLLLNAASLVDTSLAMQPETATLIGPSDTIDSVTPTFQWNAADNATWYYVYLYNHDARRVVFTEWVEEQTWYTPTNSLAEGSYRFWVQTWGNGQYGAWSESMDFTVQIPKPATATLIGPSDTITNRQPTFEWNAADNATWYYVYLSSVDTGRMVLTEWVEGQTSYTPSNNLADGNYRFWVQTWGNGKYGDWSAAMDFAIRDVVLEPVADQFVSHNEGSIQLSLNAISSNVDALSFSARVNNSEVKAYELNQQLGLHFTGNYSFNWLGAQEKWILGNGNQWFFITPNGALYRWNGTRNIPAQAGTLVATLDSSFHAAPQMLYDAAAPRMAVLVSGNQLTAAFAEGYTGKFEVEVTASAGQSSASQTFHVNVTNQTPTIAPITDQTIWYNETLTVNVSANDADGDPLTLSAQAYGVSEQFIAHLGDPQYLLPVDISFDGHEMTIAPNGFTGMMIVEVTVSDGLAQSRALFHVGVRASGESFIGLSEEAAQAKVEGLGDVFRVLARDRQALPHTEEYLVNRLNVAIEAGIITDAVWENGWADDAFLLPSEDSNLPNYTPNLGGPVAPVLSLNEFPAVGIVSWQKNFTGEVMMGTGTLIASPNGMVEWVLTAAHVLQDGLLAPAPNGIIFQVGGAGGTWVRSEQYWIHPNYSKPFYAGMDPHHDLALIKLSTPVTGVIPMKLYSGELYEDQTMYFVGFGGTDKDSQVGTKRLGANRISAIGDKTVDYRRNTGNNFHPGDSGGPNMIRVEIPGWTGPIVAGYYLAAVTSGSWFQLDFWNGGFFHDTSTRVDVHRGWIDSIINMYSTIPPSSGGDNPDKISLPDDWWNHIRS